MITAERTLGVGAWSTGTMRTEDIAQTLLDMARYVGIDRDSVEPWATLRIEGASEDGEAISEAIDVLQEHAPIYCYVGAHPDDPADFGVWADHEAIQQAIQDGDVLEPADRNGAGATINRDDGVIIDVNDHGNVTISRIGRGEVLLSLV